MRILITGGNGNLAKMIYANLHQEFEIVSVTRADFDMLDFKSMQQYLLSNSFDVLIHTAIVGGRRTKKDDEIMVYHNLLMFENLMHFSHLFKLIINFDSGAIYDRETDICNRKETELLTIPKDYYGFSKYLIYNRSLQFKNIINFRIFNIFHANEEPDRFIKACFLAKKNGTKMNIFQDKYFDFMYEDDFIKLVRYYLLYFGDTNIEALPKILNLSYQQKYKLSDIAKIIITDENMIEVQDSDCKYNYSGDGNMLASMNIEFDGLENSLNKYKQLVNIISIKNIKNIKNILFAGHDYCHNCGGIMVHYELCKILNELGINAKINSVLKTQNDVCNSYYNNDFPIDDDSTVVIYSEGVANNPLNAKNVVRWILAPLGTLSDSKFYLNYNKKDLVYYFNSELRFQQNPEKIGSIYKLLTVLYIYPNIKQTNFCIRRDTCFTYRKVECHKKGINIIHSSCAFEITRDHDQDNLIEFFNKYEFFISYDPATFISIIAALCGCISIVYPVNGLSKLDWINTTAASEYIKFKGLDNLYGIAYGLEDIPYAVSTLSLVKDQWSDIQNFFKEQTVIPFINDLQNMGNLVNTIENNYY